MKLRNVGRFLSVLLCILFFGVVLTNSVLAQEGKKKAKDVSYTILLQMKEGKSGYLVDSKGMSLYYFKKDSKGMSACAGECLTKWPVFFAEKVLVPKQLKKKDFGVITRNDGKKQTTYKGLPLYYFFKDAKPGDMNGEGINNIWYVIYPDKFKP